ncbi:hypothetical protein B296_00001913 [Ensete ventricosum]|uniref:Uncharacterized protein n=1 Tax=Ensete ventricosum TaxID=4639 RepID=A0A427AVG0_ENSVE|nr:hypothetical protein B296_00001913 [Ensete ventricosum]
MRIRTNELAGFERAVRQTTASEKPHQLLAAPSFQATAPLEYNIDSIVGSGDAHTPRQYCRKAQPRVAEVFALCGESYVCDAVLLAVDGAASAATAAAIALAIVAVGREATGGARPRRRGRTRRRARRIPRPTRRRTLLARCTPPPPGPAVSRAPPAAEPSWHVEPPAGSEEPAGVGSEPRDVGGGAPAVLGGFGLLLVKVAARHCGGQQ